MVSGDCLVDVVAVRTRILDCFADPPFGETLLDEKSRDLVEPCLKGLDLGSDSLGVAGGIRGMTGNGPEVVSACLKFSTQRIIPIELAELVAQLLDLSEEFVDGFWHVAIPRSGGQGTQ